MANKATEALKRFAPDSIQSGFKLLRAARLEPMAAAALEFRHEKSGARLLHLAADDAENLFGVAFRTPPPDDTGLPHIIEHSVLCGSKRFPVKDPFVELLKTSLATFLNAFTYPDRTIYPCSSMNHKDFLNLMRVYADAAFFPLLSEDHFRQEGHHLEFGPDGKPGIKGVVYNEMRGVYSDPDGILDRHIQHLLFESNAYGRDYGGDPKKIPDLTYGQYLDFHRRYYHPSNAWIFTYGDADPAATLEVLDKEYLSRFDAMPQDTTIAPLAAWKEPKRAVFPYPADAGEPTANRTDIAVAFATNDLRDVLATLAMRVVDVYMLDHAASPLRKALIDSKLGEELGSSGYADHQRDTFFMASLKGSEPDRAEAVERLVLDVIRRECDRGFDKEQVESALHSLELASREIRPQYPLRLMERAFAAWLYDSDPLGQIQLARRLDELRGVLAKDGGHLENLARKWLVDNPHRLLVTLVPDPNYVRRLDEETARDLDRRLAGMSEADKQKAKAEAERLEAEQSAGNSPESLATLPRLALSDVSPEPIPVPFEAEKAGGRDFLLLPMYTGGIAYLNLNLDLSGLDDADLDLLPLFCETLSKTGAAGLDYAEMAAREAACTGAVEFSAGVRSHMDGVGLSRVRMGVWLKALEPDWEKALAVLSDRLFDADFADLDRLRDIILQSRVAWRNHIVPAGNAYAALYAGRRLNPALALSERLSGCTQARLMDRLAGDLDRTVRELPDRLVRLRDKVLAGALPAAAHAGGGDTARLGREWLAANAGRFGGDGALRPLPAVAFRADRVGLAAPSDVSYVAEVRPAPPLSHPDAPALTLLGLQLSYGHLWNEVRVKGGAYGVRAVYDGARSAFSLSSYRDPNLMRTLGVYAGTAGFVAEAMDLSPAGVEQAIIGALKTLDVPVRPSYAVAAVLGRHLSGEDDAFRRRFRSRLLSLGAKDVREAAARTLAAGQAPVCAIASREKLEAENRQTDAARRLAVEPLWAAGEE